MKLNNKLLEWPEDPKQWVEFEKLITPLTELYRKVMADPKAEHEYEGYDIGMRDLACNASLEDYGTLSLREYHEERGRDVHDMFLMAAFQLGVEQGRRLERNKY